MARRISAGLAVALVSSLLAGCSDQGPVTARPASTGGSGNPASSGSHGPAPSGSALAPSTGATPGPGPTLPGSGTWAKLELDGPAPTAREDHTWTVDEDGRRAYLFGGRDGGSELDDVWSLDLETEAWTRIPADGMPPSARFGHEGAWIPGRGLAIWAGQAGSTFFDDLRLLDPATGTWQRLPSGGEAPVARYGSCSGVGPDGRLWISHGFTEDGTRFADTRAYDFVSGTWREEAPPGEGPFERCLHACWWTADGRFVLYGGQTTGTPALGDLWFLTPGPGGAPTSTWTEAPPPEPAARNLAAVARRDHFTIMFGGRGLDGQPLADTWLLAGGASGFTPLDTGGHGPPARSGGAMVYDSARDRFLLFGGVGRDAFDDAWELTFP